MADEKRGRVADWLVRLDSYHHERLWGDAVAAAELTKGMREWGLALSCLIQAIFVASVVLLIGPGTTTWITGGIAFAVLVMLSMSSFQAREDRIEELEDEDEQDTCGCGHTGDRGTAELT